MSVCPRLLTWRCHLISPRLACVSFYFFPFLDFARFSFLPLWSVPPLASMLSLLLQRSRALLSPHAALTFTIHSPSPSSFASLCYAPRHPPCAELAAGRHPPRHTRFVSSLDLVTFYTSRFVTSRYALSCLLLQVSLLHSFRLLNTVETSTLLMLEILLWVFVNTQVLNRF